MKRPRGLKRLTAGLSGSLHTRGLILWVATLATGIICVWEHVHSFELASDIETLKGCREDLLAEIGFLRMECVELSSRGRIEILAGEQLGMRYPRDGEIVRLESDGALSRAGRREEYVEGRSGAVNDG